MSRAAIFHSHHHYSHIPPFCHPADDTLRTISELWRTCIPTHLALTSSLLGTCSIIVWLFAQLPQIYKNFKIQSTAGLSPYFLVVWCLGDSSNLVGALLTGQATWQVILAAYYTFVDCVLVGQYVWYEALGKGRKRRYIVDRARYENGGDAGNGGERDPLLSSQGNGHANGSASKPSDEAAAPKPLDRNDGGPDGFKFPALLDPAPRDELKHDAPSSGRSVVRTGRPTATVAPSSNAVLLFACLCIALGHASPISPSVSRQVAPSSVITIQGDAAELAGRLISWASTVLYVSSRLPQLIKNYRRKSTAGLSPVLFAAAFCGNLLYSSSMLTNPLAWADYPPYGHGGWAGPEGSSRAEWVLSATPFFLGAAGVLLFDATMGIQFLMYGEGKGSKYTPRVPVLIETPPTRRGTSGNGSAHQPSSSRVLAIPPGGAHTDAQQGSAGLEPVPGADQASWRKVSGYMRGWVPSFSPAGSWSRSGYMASAAAAGRAARDTIAGVVTPRSRSRSRSSGGGSSDGIGNVRAEAEAWESRNATRPGSREGRGENRPLLEGSDARYGDL